MDTNANASPDPDFVRATRDRLEALASLSELGLSKSWEFGRLSCAVVGHEVALGATEDPALRLRRGSTTMAAAALASSPKLADPLVGRVRARPAGTSTAITISHERRPIDPIDFSRAYQLAALLGDHAALEALALSVEHIDPDPGFEGDSAIERGLYRSLFRVLLTELGDAARARELDAIERALSEGERLDEFRRERFVHLARPLVPATETDLEASLAHALTAHREYYSAPHRRDDPARFVAWGALAILGRSRATLPAGLVSAELPEPLVALALGPAASSEILYETPTLSARSVDEARLRLELSIPGEVRTIAPEQPGGPITLEVGAHTKFRARVTLLEEEDPDAWLRAASQLVDAGELVQRAEEDRARGALETGRRLAELALLALDGADELFRDRMVSPLGRHLCDTQPERFTREALTAFVRSFDEPKG